LIFGHILSFRLWAIMPVSLKLAILGVNLIKSQKIKIQLKSENNEKIKIKEETKENYKKHKIKN